MDMCNHHEHPYHHGRALPPWHPFRGFCCAPIYISVDEEIRMVERAKEALETRLKYINERLERLKAGRQTT